MKKNKYLLFIGMVVLAFILFAPNVHAIVKQVDNNVFTLERIEPTCDPYHTSMPRYFNEKGIFFLVYDEEERYYNYFWNGNNNCTKMNNQDLLDYYNETSISYGYDEKNNKLYEYVTDRSDTIGFTLTKDTVPQERKSYYKYNDEHFIPVYQFEMTEDMSSYYEIVELYSPKSTIIDNNLDYYKTVNGLLTSVDKPISEEIMNYYLIYDGIISKKEVNKFPKVEVESLIDNYISSLDNATLIAYHIDKIGKEFYVDVYYRDSAHPDQNQITYFDENYEIVEKYSNKRYKNVGNYVIENTISYYTYTIYDINMNFLFRVNEENTTYYLNMYEYNDVLLLALGYDNYYLITNYKVFSGNNQIYNNNDLTIKFNGILSSLSKVKINDKELDTNNYTKASGSTIITLKNEYLKTLEVGTYILKVEYLDGGYATANFVIQAVNPQTNDNIVISVLLGIMSLIGLTGLGLYTKRKDLINKKQ